MALLAAFLCKRLAADREDLLIVTVVAIICTAFIAVSLT